MSLRVLATRLFTGLRAGVRGDASHSFATLSSPQISLLRGLQGGSALKSHRYLDGGKEYRLHPLRGDAVAVATELVRPLEEQGLLLSNQKFPAATLMLSALGRRVAQQATGEYGSPLSTGKPGAPSQ